jgi:hypothetical protein
LGGKHKVLNYTKDSMNTHDRDFARQLKFNFNEKRNRSSAGADRPVLRSDEVDFEGENDPFTGRTTSFQQLSRYVLEDVLGTNEGQPFLLRPD